VDVGGASAVRRWLEFASRLFCGFWNWDEWDEVCCAGACEPPVEEEGVSYWSEGRPWCRYLLVVRDCRGDEGVAQEGRVLRIGGHRDVVVEAVVEGRDLCVVIEEEKRRVKERIRDFGLGRICAFVNSRSEVMCFY